MSRTGRLAERVTNFIEREQLFGPDDRLLLAVSGGLDSCVLLHFLIRAGYAVGIAHCNYHQRGKASDGDEQFVRQLARRHGLDFHLVHYPTPPSPPPSPSPSPPPPPLHSPPPQPQPNFQAKARNFRYQYFKKILDEYDYHLLLTAHHLDDNLETLLINLARGSGFPGLAAIPVSSDFPLVRPLLCVDRAEILTYAREHNLEWREDRSNASDDYLRNRIRHHVSPVLREVLNLGPDAMRRSFSALRGGRYFYLQGLSLTHNPELRRQGADWVLDLESCSLPYERQFTLLRHHLLPAYPISDADLRHVLGMRAGKRWIHGSLEVRKEADRLFFTRVAEQSAESVPITEFPYTLEGTSGTFRFTLVDRPADLREADAWHLRVPRLPLHLRPRKEGDRLRPLGLGGSKKVKDILIDAKVPAWQRDEAIVLCDGSHKILALLGHCIDEDSAVPPEDRYALRIQKIRSPAT